MCSDRGAGAVAVEVAYARPDKQVVIPLRVPAGTTLAAAIERSGIERRFPEIDWTVNTVGVFGRRADPGAVVRDGDRVEIYRPLRVDPKEARRQRARSIGPDPAPR